MDGRQKRRRLEGGVEALRCKSYGWNVMCQWRSCGITNMLAMFNLIPAGRRRHPLLSLPHQLLG